MKKADGILIAVLIVAAAVVALCTILFSKGGNTVTVKQNGKIVYEGEINQDKTLTLEGNIVVIEDGYAVMHSAKCKNQICVKTGKISKKGETIVCLPNKVTVQIK